MAGWKQAEKHVKHSADSASLYGKYYHWLMMLFRATIAFIMSRRVFDKKVRKDIECDTRTIGCLEGRKLILMPLSCEEIQSAITGLFQ